MEDSYACNIPTTTHPHSKTQTRAKTGMYAHTAKEPCINSFHSFLDQERVKKMRTKRARREVNQLGKKRGRQQWEEEGDGKERNRLEEN